APVTAAPSAPLPRPSRPEPKNKPGKIVRSVPLPAPSAPRPASQHASAGWDMADPPEIAAARANGAGKAPGGFEEF
ncbi:MAG: hypothetical protein K1X89_27320, partial [Myxococcaceae bacterium]|nr:hypothetical protein [Myxococcaceae bacterium]